MRRRLGAAFAIAITAATPAYAHKGDPNYLSTIESVTPAVAGVKVSVLDRDDRLELRNRSGRDVVVFGYGGEPYARVLADGRVQVNTRSPALYLNSDRDAKAEVPSRANAKAPPRWRTESGTGRFEWHDHRAHWMGSERPKKVTDPDRRTRVFAWKVEMAVDGRRGRIAGVLDWTPAEDGGPPAGALVALGGVVLAGGALVVVVRRRRRGGGGSGEAW